MSTLQLAVILLYLLSNLPRSTSQLIVTQISCGETTVGNLAGYRFSLDINMFYGGKIIVKGQDLPDSSFYLFDDEGNMAFVVNTNATHTSFTVEFDSQTSESVSPAIIPSTGPYTLIFRNNMDKTFSMSNETHILYTFNKRFESTIVTEFAFSASWKASSVQYLCNCRAPNADAKGIANCLGLT